VLHGTNERKLTHSDYLRHRQLPFIAHVDSIPEEINHKVVELSASYKEIANHVIRKIFLQFNWDDVTEEFVYRWQTKLIEGKV
ncbi:MAG: hypothetical protein ABII96_03700, partial [Candidatus Zixiibacteriota bacterium]